jgi:hypothetical protein
MGWYRMGAKEDAVRIKSYCAQKKKPQTCEHPGLVALQSVYSLIEKPL